jgi:perosamine synthetase
MTKLVDTILDTVRRVTGERNRFVPLHEPEFAGNELAYVTECIETGWVSSVGSFVDRFEVDLAAFTGARHAVVTVNGTAALHVALLLAGVRQGDEVLLPTLTFIATANATSYAGATPHFVDSEVETLAIDAGKLEARLSEIGELRDDGCYNIQTGARIAAIVVMHAFGHPAKLDELDKLARRWRIPLVEDAAESLGSTYKGRHTGNIGLVSALSFNGNKVLTTGGGGAILTNDPEIARRAKHLTTTARVADRWNFKHDEVGFNYRLPNLNAALGVAQLERLPDMLVRKRILAERYEAAFDKIDGAAFLREPPHTTSNYWLCTAILDHADNETLVEVLESLNGAGLMSRPVWTLMHRLPMYANTPRADVSCAENLAQRVINLPSSPNLVSAPVPAA